jgi:virginiamycin B lyase
MHHRAGRAERRVVLKWYAKVMRGRLVVGLAGALAFIGTVAASAAVQPADTDIRKAGAKKISISGEWLASGFGAVWASNPPEQVIYRLDPRSGRVLKTIRVPQEPCQASATGYRAVWTATCGTPGLARIDPATNRVRGFARVEVSSAVGDAGSIGAGAGGVWLVADSPTCAACVLARVNPQTLRVAARIPIRPFAAGVRVGYGAVWVTNPMANLVQKIDPRSNKVVRTTPVAGSPRFLAVGENGVWTLNQLAGSITRLDPVTGGVKATIQAGIRGSGGDMTTGGGWVWARGAQRLLTRIDPGTNRIVERYGPTLGDGSVIVGFGAVWISVVDADKLWRLPFRKR